MSSAGGRPTGGGSAEDGGGVRIVAVDAGSADARRALETYFAELAARLPDGFDPAGALDSASVAYNPPHGLFLVAAVGSDVVACGALNLLDGTTAEIKRMWVSPRHRGRGLGRQVLARLEAEAARAGRTTVVLDTNASLTEAIALYEAAGYVAGSPYNDNPHAQRWFTKRLPGRLKAPTSCREIR